MPDGIVMYCPIRTKFSVKRDCMADVGIATLLTGSQYSVAVVEVPLLCTTYINVNNFVLLG